MASSEVFVVETTDGEVQLGHLRFGEGTVTVFSGYAGRPVILDEDEVDSIVPASTHPDVEGNDDDEPATGGVALALPGQREPRATADL